MLKFKFAHENLLKVSIVSISLVILGLIVAFPLRVNSDIALFTITGEYLVDGQRPYVDYFLMNLPMIQYINVIPVLLSDFVGLNQITWVLLLCWVLMNFTIFVTNQLAVNIFIDNETARIIPLTVATYSLMVLGENEFAQREHLFILLFTPFLLIRILRWESAQRTNSAFLFGMLAGVSIMIKPHFVLVPIVAELYWLARYRQMKQFFTLEIYGLLTALAVHAIYYLVNPDVLTGQIATLKLVSTGSYANFGPLAFVAHDRFAFVPFLAAPFLYFWHKHEHLKYSRFFGLISLTGFVIVLLQGRGFPYHWMIFTFMLFLSMAFFIRWFLEERILPDLKLRTSAPVIFSGVILLIATIFALRSALHIVQDPDVISDDSNLRPVEAEILKWTDPDDNVLVLSVNPGPAYTSLPRLERNQTSSYTVAYPLILKYDEPLHDLQTELPNSVKHLLETTKEDIAEHKPKLVVLDATVTWVDDVHRIVTPLLESTYSLVQETDLFAFYLYTGDMFMHNPTIFMEENVKLVAWTRQQKIEACDQFEIKMLWQFVKATDSSPTVEIKLSNGEETIYEVDHKVADVILKQWRANQSYFDIIQMKAPCEAGKYEVVLRSQSANVNDDRSSKSTVDGGNILLFCFTVN